MPDFLSEKDWGAEIKALKITKDGGLQDALADWGKVKGKAPDARFEALEEVIDAAVKAQKLLKDQKDLVKFAATTESKAQVELARVEKEIEKNEDSGEDAVDKELYDALKRAKTSRMFAVVIARGSSDGKLIMGKSKVKPTDVSGAKKEAGGGTVFRAMVHFEAGIYVFELKKEPPQTLAQLIRKLAKQQAGLLIRVICRTGANLEDLGEEPGESEEDGDSPQPIGTAPAPPSGPSPNGQGGGLGAEYRKKVSLLTPLAKKALIEKRVDTALVSRLLQAAQSAAAEGNFAKGLEELKSLEQALSQTLDEPGESETPEEELSEEQEKVQFDERLKAVGADLLVHLRSNPDDRAELGDLLREARDAGNDGAFDTGHALLDRLERIVEAGMRAAREKETKEQIPEGAGSTDALDPDRIEEVVTAWVEARDTAVRGATALAASLRSSIYDELHPIAAVVDDLVDEFPEGLDDCLEDLRSATLEADGPRIKQFKSRSKAQIKSCLDYLNANGNVIAACEEHPLGGPPVAIVAPLKQSLRQILELVK
jgi:hypothetical protein